MPLFRKPKYTIVRVKKKEIPEGLWTKCDKCSQPIYNKALEENLKVCSKCGFYFSLGAWERVNLLIDSNTFQEHDKDLCSDDPLEFKEPKDYKAKVSQDQKATGLKAAVVSGEGLLDGKLVAFGVTDSRFIMGSMGSVVGEKLTRIIEMATKRKLPVIIVSGSGGGARMQEGMFSLMQMAKTSAAISYHHQAGLPYISVLTNPTMGGVMASFAALGDVIIAEPKALIGFAGPRVIKQTIRQDLPEGFQRSEFILEHGLIDMIVQRKNLKETIIQLINYLT